jgi:hypothetical protein
VIDGNFPGSSKVLLTGEYSLLVELIIARKNPPMPGIGGFLCRFFDGRLQI